ncbi:TenA family protein [Halegenticoccus soli]|uniref:TenA family protein n=1 Tax=Halegenticoccus soli TaxID=1985678 RepID=UPI000C6CC98A|nr:TenA family protein [Halegenticoccus soli]
MTDDRPPEPNADRSEDSVATRFADADADRFTDWLRDRSEPDWTAATEHRFVRELADGTIDDAAFARYLVQDYLFVESLAGLVGYAVGQAPSMAEKARLAEFLGTVTDEENDYFERSFEALGVPPERYRTPEPTETTAAFRDLLAAAAREGGYAETLAVFVPVEWAYRTWAGAVDAPDDPFYLREWIELHDTPEFDGFVAWLRGQLDEVGPTLAPRRQERVAELFERAVRLEVAFFDSAYEE